jgi:hypothetical protein
MDMDVMQTTFWLEGLKGKQDLVDQGTDGRIILKMDLRVYGSGQDSTDQEQSFTSYEVLNTLSTVTTMARHVYMFCTMCNNEMFCLYCDYEYYGIQPSKLRTVTSPGYNDLTDTFFCVLQQKLWVHL